MIRLSILIITILISVQVTGQKKMLNKFLNLHTPEKIWVLTHPFVAKKSHTITLKALSVTNRMMSDKDLDASPSGGQVDAFRHTYWMSLLCQSIGPRKSKRLGIAHEKGNKIDFEKKNLEEGNLPDYVSCEMDLKNNELGIITGLENPNSTDEELIGIVKNKILQGKAFIIRKNQNGQFLDSSGKIIPVEDYTGKWYSPKNLVPSNYKN